MPKALALESNPFGRINELRSLLSDRYSRTAILKEWLQSGQDDARDGSGARGEAVGVSDLLNAIAV